VRKQPFSVPEPELEFILFVLRTVQRGGVRDLVAPGPPRWLLEVQPEYGYLLARVDRQHLESRLAELLPNVDRAFFDSCARAIRPEASRWRRMSRRLGLHWRLLPHAWRPSIAMLPRRFGRRLRLLPRPGRMRLARGGTVFAFVGGDGAGKTTCLALLRGWLSGPFEVMTAHLGRPPRSLTTLAVGGVLKLRRALGRWLGANGDTASSGILELLRLVCTARDRYRLFVKARRFAAAGGVALCERYPIPQNRLLVGPEIARLLGHGQDTPLARRLMRAEQDYYRRITPPDVVIVLMVDPELAVQRKVTEPPDYVRARARIIWETDWTGTGAHLVDAGRSLPQVITDLKTLLWSEV
jgi:thymidylate kinase